MTSRERILRVLHGQIPDSVPCCPDISNMVPCRLTGKPFWDIYLYRNPPLWKAHLDAIKYFNIDGGFELYDFAPVDPVYNTEPDWEERIVHRDDERIITQRFVLSSQEWEPWATLYRTDTPPIQARPKKLGLPAVPDRWEPVEGRREWPKGYELWKHIRQEMGDHGVLGMGSGMSTCVLNNEDDVYAYYDNPKPFFAEADRRLATAEARIKTIAGLEIQPDFLLCGASGTLIWQTPDMVRELVLPMLKSVTKMAAELGIPTHVHSCGPEKELVQMAALETDLTIIDPLEAPPMGNCSLRELKTKYGDRIVLKGNLHTTDVMLFGSVDDVIAASKQAIDDAAEGGGFILSTGDQCGRDTPDENLLAMVETARTYGVY